MSKTSKYEEMKKNGEVRRGRKPVQLTAEQARDLQESKKNSNRQRQESRRKSLVVLAHQYKDEFDDLYKSELAAIKSGVKKV